MSDHMQTITQSGMTWEVLGAVKLDDGTWLLTCRRPGSDVVARFFAETWRPS